MRFFLYNDPSEDEPVKISYDQIIEEYYEYWSGEMERNNRLDLINPKNCLEDWLIIYWGWEIK